MPPSPVSLSLGARGADVVRLQQALAAAGFDPGTADGSFGESTAKALRAFQASKNLTVDARVGSETWKALAVKDTFAPQAPPSAEEKAKFEKFAAMVKAGGGEVNPGGKPTILALRSGKTESIATYGDRFVVLTKDGRVTELVGSTKPSGKATHKSKDADGDGKKDLGILRPGSYQVQAWKSIYPGTALASYVVQRIGAKDKLDNAVPAWRDTNQDRFFSDEEKAASVRRGDVATEILFHAGGGEKPNSVGCLTLSPKEMKRLIEAVGGPSAAFSLTLIQTPANA